MKKMVINIGFCVAIVLGLINIKGAFAKEIDLKITSLTNIRGNGALEACGTATHPEGKKPLLVTVKHDESYYTTLTDFQGRWCILFKRWTFGGSIEVEASTLEGVKGATIKM